MEGQGPGPGGHGDALMDSSVRDAAFGGLAWLELILIWNGGEKETMWEIEHWKHSRVFLKFVLRGKPIYQTSSARALCPIGSVVLHWL